MLSRRGEVGRRCDGRERSGERDVKGQLRGVHVRGQVTLQAFAGGVVLDQEGVLHAQLVPGRQLIVAAQQREDSAGYHLRRIPTQYEKGTGDVCI